MVGELEKGRIPPFEIQRGRYCLNDFHKASGGEKKHEPYRFTRRVETSALIDEIVNTPDSGSFITPMHSLGGRNGGTFVVKELSPYVDFGPYWRDRKLHRSEEFHNTISGGLIPENGVIPPITQNPGVLPLVTIKGRTGGTYVVKELV